MLRLVPLALLVATVSAGCTQTVLTNPTLWNFTCTLLDGRPQRLDQFYGKVILVENVASMWGNTLVDYPQMNELISRYGSKGLQILGFPCNQFGMQENMGNGEILNLLKYVRPGNGFIPAFPLFQKIDVNGITADPLFRWIREKLPLPFDNLYGPFIDAQKLMLWEPASRTDIAWSFSKFLIGRNGVPIKRWTDDVQTTDAQLVADIEKALSGQESEIEVLPSYADAHKHKIVQGWQGRNPPKEL